MGRKLTAIAFSLGCLHGSSAWALGLGELQLDSFLNEPLKASVDLLNTGGLHEDEIRIRLGTREDFKRLGLDRSFFLTSIEFDVVIDNDGTAHISLTTDEPVLEPYLDFIVEARWPSGRLLREYTVLVDPPTFSDTTPVVSASERVEQVEGIPAPGKKKEIAANTGTRVDMRKSTLAPGEMPQRDFNAEAGTSPVSGSRYMIKRDDTLWTIASRARPEGATVHQTMLDIQRLNPDAFIHNNINRVKAGYIIYLPTADDISSGDYEAALAEVREQNNAWREGREAELAASRGPSLRISADEEEEAAPVEVGDDALAAAEKAAQAAAELESAAAGEISADDAGRVEAMEDRVDTLERIVDIKDEQIAALQAALAQAQAATGDGSDADLAAAIEEEYAGESGEDADTLMEGEDPLAEEAYGEVDEEAATATDGEIGEQFADQSSVEEVETDDTAVDEVVQETPEAKKVPVVKQSPKPAPSSSGGIMDYIWYIVGAVVLGIVGLFIARRRGEDDDYEDDSLSDDVFSDVELREQSLDVEEEPVEPEPAPAPSERGYGERKHDAYADDVEAGDALAEADIYIAYGRHRQAIDLLNNALANEPNNASYRLKLLEIHTELSEREEASEQLHQLRSTGDENSIARGEELLASFEAGAGGAAAGESELAPNPLDTMEDAPEAESEFSGLEIEEPGAELEGEEDLDLSGDFAIDDSGEEDIVIAADANGMSTKLDLARAYLDMGDDDGARQILEEVMAEGSDELKAEAQSLLDRIG